MNISHSKMNYEYIFNLMERGSIKDVNTVRPILSGGSCLHIAVINNDKNLVDYLLQKKANVNIIDKFRGTALHLAVMNKNLAIVESLINYGADVTTQFPGANFYTPLQLAVEQNNKNIVEFLIKRGVDVNIVVPGDSSTSVDTPLHIAIDKGNVEMVELLLKNNADPNIDIRFYEKPLMVATNKENLKIMKLLIEYGADVNALSGSGFFKESSLHVAVQEQNLKAVKFLLNDPLIDVNITSSNGNSVLHDGVQGVCSIAIIKHLLDAGVDINLKNSIGRTAFNSLHLNPPEVIKTSKEHIVKLSAASFHVSNENLALIVNNKKLSEVRDNCMKEIEKMKKTKIGSSNFTYYDLLSKCEHTLATGLKCVPNNIILDLDIPSTFPLYDGMITYRLRKVLGRKNFLINVTDLIYDIFYDLQLPSTFTRMIFKYLTNGDLKKLIV